MTNVINRGGLGDVEPILDVQDLKCAYEVAGSLLPFGARRPKNVVHGVSFAVKAGETFALVGESGCGKTTIVRAVAGLLTPVGGKVAFAGMDVTKPVAKRRKDVRRKIQIVFQNPDSSLNPKRRISYAIGRPLEYFFGLRRQALRERIGQALLDVKLDPAYARRFPAQLSCGERQRVAIARALAAEPSLMLCDEILSALDVSVQASVIELLKGLQEERGITYLFVSHDLAVVRSLAHRVGVLYLGRLWEVGTVEEVFTPPFHPYTGVLLMAVPEPIPGSRPPEFVLAAGEFEDEGAESACPFAPRCPRKVGPICEHTSPPWRVSDSRHGIACHISRDELVKLGTTLRQAETG